MALYICCADFIAPKETGIQDYLGMFVVSAGFGLEKLTEKYKKDQDDYKVTAFGTRGVLVSALVSLLIRVRSPV